MKLGPVFFVGAIAALLAPAVAAQNQTSLGVGAGTVRHERGASFSALTLSPAVQRLSSSSYLGAGGALSLLEGGVWAAQGRGDLWLAVPRAKLTGARLAFSATASTSTRSDGIAAASGAAIGEALWTGARGGVALGAGPAIGVIESFPGIGALRVRGRGWWQLSGRADNVGLSLIVEGTRLAAAWYTDVVAGVSFESTRIAAGLWASGRFSAVYGSSGAASGTLQYFVTPTLAAEATGGSYLRDPFQGLPRAGFFTAGVRIFRPGRAAASSSPPATLPALQPLIAAYRGDTAVVRFRMEGARTVAIAGSWNAWTPIPLRDLGGAIWEATLLLPPGTYYFNLVVDGAEWVVPGGVAAVSDGMGGLVAVLTVL